MMLSFAVFACLYLLLGYLTTRVVLYIATRKNVLDQPNERSSHSKPTPRIGGLGFVSVISLILVIELFVYAPQPHLILALLFPALLLSGIGLIDDLFSLSNRIRFCFQIILASIVVILVAPFTHGTTELTIATIVILTIAVAWLINLFNFMDGIDGIAAAEAIFILLSLALLLWLGTEEKGWSRLTFFTAMPVIGFLLLNWSPAKIFMGDSGSTYLGLFIGCFMFIAIKFGISTWSCLILAGVFLSDATLTLVTRIITGQEWFKAHRSHAYQKLAAKLSHAKVSAGVTMVNIFWLLPLAIISNHLPTSGPIITVVAYAPLVAVCLKVKAGWAE
jgi:Fuc2NAc and GlcNAc transferase